jgi:hypothetical protein
VVYLALWVSFLVLFLYQVCSNRNRLSFIMPRVISYFRKCRAVSCYQC